MLREQELDENLDSLTEKDIQNAFENPPLPARNKAAPGSKPDAEYG